MNLPTLITPAQAAEMFQVPESRLARWRSKGVGPDYVKIEGRVGYTTDAVCEFLKRSTVRFERNGVLSYDDESN